jgi:predicted RND superfamily exporter protein
MLKNTLIIALVIVIIYLYYQQKKQSHFTSPNSGRTLFSFEEDQLKESNQELQTHLDQALALQEANKTKMAEQTHEISTLKNRLNIYEGVGASSSGEDEKSKAVLNERDELKRTNQNLELDKEKLTEDLNSILTE